MTEQEWLDGTDPAAMLAWLTRRGESEILGGTPFPDPPSDRKLRLFACACVRQVWSRESPESRAAVEAAERFADGQGKLLVSEHIVSHRDATMAARMVAEWAARVATDPNHDHSPENRALPGAYAALLRCIVGNPFRPVLLPPGPKVQCADCCGEGTVLRMVGGSYFQTPPGGNQYEHFECETCDCSGEVDSPCPWLTPTVANLAQATYDDRDFARLPILADALQDAGCNNDDLLGHLLETVRCPNRCGGPGWGCPLCGESGRILAPHARGCWALDLLLGKS